MANLTAKQQSFIRLMTESDELARRGFDLLLKRDDFESFFDALKDAGLFAPTLNPAPTPVNQKGYFRVLYWSALDYLLAVARRAGERDDLQLAEKVMQVVRAVSTWRDSDGAMRDNYHTFRKFAEILGVLPAAAIALTDLDFLPSWLSSKFDHGLVGHALDEGVLKRFLASDHPEEWRKALAVVQHCTEIRWQDSSEIGQGGKKPVTAVEDYWLRELIEHHSPALGRRIGKEAAELFLGRVRELFGTRDRDTYSTLHRPAIEEHAQNHSFNGPENRSVEGLRDVVLSWSEHDLGNATPFVGSLLTDKLEIVRRVGIYVVNQRWNDLRALYLSSLGPSLFEWGHIHELYNLLRNHFAQMSDEEKAATVKAIREPPPPTRGEEQDQIVKLRQIRWLSAISGQGFEPADAWLAELQADQKVESVSEHADFSSYMTTSFGPGPSPFQVQELVAYATDGTLIDKLNTFEQPDLWRGPTLEALVGTLQEAVGVAPGSFLELLPQFLGAKRPFQYGVIAGFKQVWEASKGKKAEFNWNEAWESLVTFFEQLIGTAEFWAEEVPERGDLVPTRNWIGPAIAEFLEAGTREDEHAYPAALLPRTLPLINIFLQNSKLLSKPGDDPMFQAVNSPKGKAIEALFLHSLRTCRVADRECGGHDDAWAALSGIFDAELAKCKNSNYEFSTLVGAYISHLYYLSRQWLRTNLHTIFSEEMPVNAMCAAVGLAYAPASGPVYVLLRDTGVAERLLQYELKARHAREKLIERIALAYLWAEDELDSPRFQYIFSSGNVKDLEYAAHFFWTVSGEELTGAQKERVLQFWERCIAWSRDVPDGAATVLASLSMLTPYLASADGRSRDLLMAVAPCVSVGHNADRFIQELARFVEDSPDSVNVVLAKVLETYIPVFDYEDRLRSLLTRLAEKGKKEDVLKYAERLRSLPGIQALFDRLTGR